MQIKAGYQSTEFYITLLSQIIGIATVAGWIMPIDAPQLLKAISDVIGGVVAILPAVVYIYNRTWLKKQALTVKAK